MSLVINAKFLTQRFTGTQHYAWGLSKELRQMLPSAQYICPNKIMHQDMADIIKPVTTGNLTNFLWEQIDLPIYLKKNKDPLFLDFGYNAPVFYKNKIVSLLDLSTFHFPEWYSKTNATYINTLTKLYSKYNRHIITLSEYSKNDMIENLKLKESQISVINPSYPTYFDNKSENDGNNIYGDYILAVSSVSPRKNFLALIKAFKLAKVNGVKLVVVGEKNNSFASHEDFGKEIDNVDSIIFTGYIDNNALKTLYQNALLFVYPSIFEGFGIPPLEAMACDCPTLVSDTTSMPEVCGDASYYINPFDISNMAEGIKIMLNDSDLRNTLIKKGRERIKLFSWKKSALDLIQVIQSCE